MTENYLTFQQSVEEGLKKACGLTDSEIQTLWTINAAIIGCATFSLAKIEKLTKGAVTQKMATNALRKYARNQEFLIWQQLAEICASLKPGQKIYLIIDDTLLRKRGKQIFGTFRWYDHTIHRAIHAICLLHLAVVVEGTLRMLIPWILFKPPTQQEEKKKRTKEQDVKTQAAIHILKAVIQELDEFHVSHRRIVVLADSWFSSQPMLTFLRQIKVGYRIASKKNYGVQGPNFQAIQSAKKQHKGRKRTHFVKYRRLDDYCGEPLNWLYFTTENSGERVYHYEAEVTLKASGRVTVYGYYQTKYKEPLFILAPITKNRPPTAKTIYREYHYRWIIEEAHRDLKQQWGLTKCHNRQELVVYGFIGLIEWCYSIWRQKIRYTSNASPDATACPTWAEEFHHYHLTHVFACPA